MTQSISRSLSWTKDRAPAGVKHSANVLTRRFGMATAAARPLPDFVIAGTKRGGTTSLWNYLVGHPQVWPMYPASRGLKSTAYFFENLDRGERWYRSHFPLEAHRRLAERSSGVTVTGEASPFYMLGPHVPRLMADLMPDLRVIILLRDPVARAYGHYQERVKEGVEPLSFEDALAAEPERTAGEWERMVKDETYYSRIYDYYSYRERGIYEPQLRRILASFSASHVLILRSEDLYEDLQSVFDTTCRFLGIAPRTVARPVRHNYIPRLPMASQTAETLRAFYEPHNEDLYRLLGRHMGWAGATSKSVRGTG